MTNYKEIQPLGPWDIVEFPPGHHLAGKKGRFVSIRGGYTYIYSDDDNATHALPGELSKLLRRPFDVGDVVMCSFGSTTVAGKIVERGAWGELWVRRYDNGDTTSVVEGNIKRMDNPWMSVEELKSRFPEPPEGMFWDLMASVDDEDREVAIEVCLNAAAHDGGSTPVKYTSVVWSGETSEFELFEIILREAEDLVKNFSPKDMDRFLRAQQIGFEFGVIRG